MNNGVIIFLKDSDSVIKHSIDQFGIRRSPYGPGNRQSIKAVDNRREVDLSCWYMKLCDISEPFHIWLLGVEIPFDHVRDSRGYLSFIGTILLAFNIWYYKHFFLHELADNLLGYS